jgi:hypothetical protein
MGFLGGTFNALSPEIVSLLSVAFSKDYRLYQVILTPTKINSDMKLSVLKWLAVWVILKIM